MSPLHEPLDAVRALERAAELNRKETPMRGMRRLAEVTEHVTKSLDAQADQVAERIEAAHERGKEAVARFRDYAGDMERAAAEIEAALGQFSNMPPSPPSEP